jgi:hypothetical protein
MVRREVSMKVWNVALLGLAVGCGSPEQMSGGVGAGEGSMEPALADDQDGAAEEIGAQSGACPVRTVHVAPGEEIALSWHGLTEDIDGNPYDGSGLQPMALAYIADAAAFAATCSFTTFEVAESVPAWQMGDQSRDVYTGRVPAGLVREDRVVRVMWSDSKLGDVGTVYLVPDAGSNVTEVDLTPGDWIAQ